MENDPRFILPTWTVCQRRHPTGVRHSTVRILPTCFTSYCPSWPQLSPPQEGPQNRFSASQHQSTRLVSIHLLLVWEMLFRYVPPVRPTHVTKNLQHVRRRYS